MKKILTFAAIAMIGMAAISGCSKKSSSPSYTMKASIGGSSFSVTNVYATLVGTELAITGSSGTSISTPTAPYFSVIIANYSSPMTYSIDTTLLTPVVYATYAPSMTMTDWKYSHTGSITITSVSTSSVVGSFSFTCADGTVISGGSFTAHKY